VHFFSRAGGFRLDDLVVPPDITPALHGHIGSCVFENNNAGNVGAAVERLIDDAFEVDDLLTPTSAIGCYDDAGSGIGNTIDQRLGRKAGKDNGMNCANAGAREDRKYELRDHGEVDTYPVTLFDALSFQHIGRTT